MKGVEISGGDNKLQTEMKKSKYTSIHKSLVKKENNETERDKISGKGE